MQAIIAFFDTSGLSPHGYCLLWRPDLVLATVGADSLVAVSYFSIPVALGYFVVKRADLEFRWVFFLFGAFILLCGGTHVMEVVTFWQPLYGWETAFKAITALVSVATAVALWPLMPYALAVPGLTELRHINGLLAVEIQERQSAEAGLRRANSELESRVAERTAALQRLTEDLQAEIAERAQIEDGLRASGELLRATLDAAPFPVCVERPDSTVTMWNRAAERDFGFPQEEIVGTSHRALYLEADGARAGEVFREATGGASMRNVQVELRRRDGRPVTVSLSSAPVREPDGRIRAVVLALEDVTLRNATEAQLRQAQKMEAIGNLTGGMAHDFNNLLGIIVGNLDSLDDAIAQHPGNQALIADAIDAALRGADLTRRLLAFARRQPLDPEHTDLNTHVERVATLLRRLLGEAIAFDVRIGSVPLPVLVDRAQLEAAIANLATNARDAMPRGGTLTVRTAFARLDADEAAKHPGGRAGDYAMAEVCDTGTGIDPAIVGRIFEPFFTTKEEGRGSGLGLAMVFGFLNQSGGHVNVRSDIGKGTCVRLYLPLVRAPGAPETAQAPAAPARSEQERILVVEDNARLRHIVVIQLASLGYRVLEAGDAQQALSVLRDGPPVDLLFTDIVMPGDMNGSELAAAARSLLPRLKVVLTSGFPEARAESGGWSSGPFRLLVKPYRKDDLARTVRRALDAE